MLVKAYLRKSSRIFLVCVLFTNFIAWTTQLFLHKTVMFYCSGKSKRWKKNAEQSLANFKNSRQHENWNAWIFSGLEFFKKKWKTKYMWKNCLRIRTQNGIENLCGMYSSFEFEKIFKNRNVLNSLSQIKHQNGIENLCGIKTWKLFLKIWIL